MFDYFYGAQAEQFAFYRVPKVLFTNDRFKYLSAEAKTLYGILLDRVPLSAKNGWIDEQGRVYMRTKDVRAIQEFGKYVPAFAAYEKNRLRLYREAAQEAEDIMTRWEDEIDEDYEPDEYFSD